MSGWSGTKWYVHYRFKKKRNVFHQNILGAPGIRSRFATLIVLVPPEPPKIVQGDYMVTTEGREIELECISHGGKPAAEVISILFLLLFFRYEIFCINHVYIWPFIHSKANV